jgi:hypothetical protein
MRLYKKYKQKQKLKQLIFKEFQKNIKIENYKRALILSKRYLKLDK